MVSGSLFCHLENRRMRRRMMVILLLAVLWEGVSIRWKGREQQHRVTAWAEAVLRCPGGCFRGVGWGGFIFPSQE